MGGLTAAAPRLFKGRSDQQVIMISKCVELTHCISCCQLVSVMSVTVQLDLPDALVKEARASGLLESKRLGEILSNELRRSRARKQFGEMLEKVRSQPGREMSMDEIQVEVDAVREERRREGGR